MIGVPNPWVIVAALVALAAAGAGGSYVGWKMRDADAQKERVAVANARAQEAAVAAKKIKDLEERNRAEEAQHATELAVIGAEHEQKEQALEDRRRRDVAAARDGALKLRVPGACPVQPGGGEPNQVAAGAVQHPAATGELPGPIAAALLELANDADQVVGDLNECLAVVAADRAGPKGTTP